MSDWLNEIEVARPCHEDWAAMRGDERARRCASCRQDVYDLSGLTRAEALSLVRRAQGGEEVCVRFRRRADGTVLTADCPSQVRRARVVRKGLRGVAASAAAVFGGALAQGCEPSTPPPQPPAYSQVMGLMIPAGPGDPADSYFEDETPDPAVGSGEACCPDGLGPCCLPQATGGALAQPGPDAPREPQQPCEGAPPKDLAGGDSEPAPRTERRLPRAGE